MTGAARGSAATGYALCAIEGANSYCLLGGAGNKAVQGSDPTEPNTSALSYSPGLNGSVVL